MKRALMYASVASMIQQFNMENIRLLQEAGYEVDVACNMEQGSTITTERIAIMKQDLEKKGVRVFHIPVPRKVTAVREILKSLSVSKQLMNDRKYDLIHCHSPIGSIICRLANRFSKNYCKAKMIYTAHGFHFFKGGPKSSWLLFYPVEKMLSRYTDVLITINQEDYALAKKNFHAKQVLKVPGVGVDTQKYRDCVIDRTAFRSALGVSDSDTLVLSVGELSDRKNHSVIIRAIHKLKNPRIHYAIVGKGDSQEELENLIAELDMKNQVALLGFRSDIPALCKAADIFAFASKREGLGLAAIEAMAAGLPIITSNVNGINDYSVNGVTGFSCGPMDVDTFSESIRTCMTEADWIENVKKHNGEVAKQYDIHEVNRIMKELYNGL